MSTTPTPRTDYAAFANSGDPQWEHLAPVDMYNFARQLERELQQATAERDHLKSLVKDGDVNFSNAVVENEQLRSDLARVTDERDSARSAHCSELSNMAQVNAAESAAIRARVAELEKERDGLKQRNAELVAESSKLRGIVRAAYLHCLDNCTLDDVEAGKRLSVAEQRQLGKDLANYGCLNTLARAESAAPAKHCENCAPEFGCFDGGEPCYKKPLVKSTPAKHPDTVDAEAEVKRLTKANKKLAAYVDYVEAYADAEIVNAARFEANNAAMKEARHD